MLTCIPPHLRDEISQPRIEPSRTTPSSKKTYPSRIGMCGEGRGQREWVPEHELVHAVDLHDQPSLNTKAAELIVDEKRYGAYGPGLMTVDSCKTPYGLSEKEQLPYLPQPVTQRTTTSQARSRQLPFASGRWLACLAIPLLIVLHLVSPSILSSYSFPLWTINQPIISALDQSYVDRCHALLTPPNGTHTSRLQALTKVLSEGSVYITEPGPSAQYYLGAFSKEDWSLSERPFLIAVLCSADPSSSITEKDVAGEVILLTPAFEALRASLIPLPSEIKSHVRWVQWREDQSPYTVLAEHLGSRGVGSFVLDGGVRQFVGRELAGVLKEVGEGEGDTITEVGKIRERKSAYEVELLRCANTFTLHAIRQTRERMHIGITESQTAKILEEEMDKTGLVGGEGLILFGENAALPHGSGTDRKLGKADMILIDAGGKWGGYVSDITRTFALPASKIPQSHIDLWEAVRKAQRAPRTLLHSPKRGTSDLRFSDLDKAARAIVSLWKAGIPVSDPTSVSIFESSGAALTEDAPEPEPDFSIFTHRLGHGIGLEGHESPYLVQGPQGDRIPQIGNVFSLEPGVYLPAEGEEVNDLKGIGVRLEDCYVITGQEENGAWKGEWLSGPVERWGDI